MNKQGRIAMLKAMDLIARSCNNENCIDLWLTIGIADGDAEEDRELDFYTNDDTFAEIMNSFLVTMKQAQKDGGLYCDGVCSENAEKDE
ncbi:MAG: hypothetical protein II498_08990 [Ruminococcus sp.]|nr:hypothetical protein [Ruminococcus sp.]